MSHLKSLTLTIAPHQIERNPKLIRRQRLIERLEEQRKLATDSNFTVTVRRWVKDTEGVKQPFDRIKRIKPWWKSDANGGLVLVLKAGLRTIVSMAETKCARWRGKSVPVWLIEKGCLSPGELSCRVR